MISYTSFMFLILFFGITYVVYSVMPLKGKWIVLLISSYAFYFISAKGHILPLVLSTLAVWAAGNLIQKQSDAFKAEKKGLKKEERKRLKAKYEKRKSVILALGIVFSLGILLVCKYSNFFIDTLNAVFSLSIDSVKIVQPLGISFYTLSAVSYLVDVKRGSVRARKNPFRVSLYLSFMLNIVEGPIARYDILGEELEALKPFSPKDALWGAERVVWGLFKKIVIADRAAELVNGVFDNSGKYSGLIILLSVLFYTLQLYLEFSGVMDVVCGLGEMMGIKLPENFRRPFFAKSINEFWQRWHITLGTWLRDYIFYPVSLSKGFQKFTKSARKRFHPYYANLIPIACALFFVWFANGFWHGAGFKYIVYGLYYYVLMMLAQFLEPLFERLCRGLKINRASKSFSLFQMLRNFVIVNIGMLIFRADSLKQAWQMLTSVFVNINLSPAFLLKQVHENGMDILDLLVILVGTAIVFAVSLVQEKGIDIREKIGKLPFMVKFIGMLAAVVIIAVFGAYGDGYGIQDLIYANF